MSKMVQLFLTKGCLQMDKRQWNRIPGDWKIPEEEDLNRYSSNSRALRSRFSFFPNFFFPMFIVHINYVKRRENEVKRGIHSPVAICDLPMSWHIILILFWFYFAFCNINLSKVWRFNRHISYLDAEGQEFTIVFLDSEGIDAATGEGLDDNQIFTLTVLLTSVFYLQFTRRSN